MIGTLAEKLSARLSDTLKERVPDALTSAKNSAIIASRMLTYLTEASIKSRFEKDPVAMRAYLVEKVSRDSRPAMQAIGYDIKAIGRDEQLMKNKNFLLVGNHMSYLDPLVIASVQPTLFVTSVDMGETPGLGHITKMGGCIHIERRHRGHVDRDLGVMSEALKQGFNVMIFPEGTSSNGQDILPFKKSLLMAAVEAGVDIMPVCLKYTEIDGEPFSAKNADKICWYGDMSFGPHFVESMKSKNVKVEIHFLEPIQVTKDSTRDELALKSHTAVRKEYMKGRV